MAEKQLLIVGHVPSVNTQRLRDAVEEGASSSDITGVRVRALSPFDAGPEDIIHADGVILGTTENLGYMSGALKDFFDRTYYDVLEKKTGNALCPLCSGRSRRDRNNSWRDVDCDRFEVEGCGGTSLV